MSYFVDIMEPSKDLNKAVEQLGDTMSMLYKRSWDEDKKDKYNDHNFNLNIAVFVDMWVSGVLKLFIVYDRDDSNKPVGFLIGMTFRPLPYEARVFQVEDWYVLPEHREAGEKLLFEHIVQAIRYMSCDEIWTSGDVTGDAPDLGANWKRANCFHRYRFVKG